MASVAAAVWMGLAHVSCGGYVLGQFGSFWDLGGWSGCKAGVFAVTRWCLVHAEVF